MPTCEYCRRTYVRSHKLCAERDRVYERQRIERKRIQAQVERAQARQEQKRQVILSIALVSISPEVRLIIEDLRIKVEKLEIEAKNQKEEMETHLEYSCLRVSNENW